jgi:dihydrodipicolinate synthase/N-acetylneuraminate lyase
MIILKGVVVPMVTPLKKQSQDEIDEVAVDKLCNFLISKGIHGLFPCGTTGE